MKFEINPYRIEKDPRNQVTSPNVFKKNQRKVSSEYKFDDEGLFSRKIFGRIGKCECGELSEPGWCDLCGCRVVDIKDMPDFFIDLGTFVPKLYCDWGKYAKVKDLLTFDAFAYEEDDGTYSIVKDDDDADLKNRDPKRIKIGLEAARLFYDDIDEWKDRYMTDYISVPHTIYRPNLRMSSSKVIFSPINKLLIEILTNIKRVNQYSSILEDDDSINYYKLSFYNEIYKQYIESMREIFRLFSEGKTSFVGSDLRAHRITGAIKGTVINRYDIDEDIILIGDTFIQTLYPYLYKKYKGDMEKINEHFIKNEERVILNRPPTICHLSIIGLKPRVASCYKLGTFSDYAVGPNVQSQYDEENDTLGIRTVAINPIISNGLASDFDGDTLLVVAIYGKKAKKEVDAMLPSKNFMDYSNGNIRNDILEDLAYIANKKD